MVNELEGIERLRILCQNLKIEELGTLRILLSIAYGQHTANR